MPYLYLLVVPVVFFLTLNSSFGESITVPADERAFTLISQELTGDSEEAPLDEGKETVTDSPEISFSIWAALAVVLGFGFGGLLALRARAKAKAEKVKD